MRVRYRYVHEDRDRHGNVRVYFWRRPGPKVRLTETPGSPEFASRYRELLDGAAPDASKPQRPVEGTFRWLVSRYVASQVFASLDPSTQRVRRQILEHCCHELIQPGKPASPEFGAMPLRHVTTGKLRLLRDRKHGLPEAANGRVKALRALYKWASKSEGTGVSVNPARDVETLANASTGFPEWSLGEVEVFEARYPPGSREHLALAILLYTGMRRSDVAQFGRQHISRRLVTADDGTVYPGWISKPQHKGRGRHPQTIEVPLLQPLADAIETTTAVAYGGRPRGLALMLTVHGRPFSIAGFGNWFSDRCRAAGLVDKSAHGLRKAGATRAAEAGATAHQLMAMFGWRTLAEAEHYTRAADRKRLAAAGMRLLAQEQ